jgi:hypothetical protein
MGEPGSPRDLSRGVESPGEESLAAAIAVQATEAQPAFGQIEPMRGQVLAGAEQQETRQLSIGPHKRPRIPSEGIGDLACRKAAPCPRTDRSQRACQRPTGLQSAEKSNRFHRSAREDRDVAVRLDDRISALIPTERQQTHRVTCPWPSPAGELGRVRRPLPERFRSGSTRAPKWCHRR